MDTEMIDVWWEPKNKEAYWYIGDHGQISRTTRYTDIDHESDERRFEIGNVYRTQEAAQKELDRRVAITEMKKYLAKNFGKLKKDYVDECYSIDVYRPREFPYHGDIYMCSWKNRRRQPDGLYIEKKEDVIKFIKDQDKNLRVYSEM